MSSKSDKKSKEMSPIERWCGKGWGWREYLVYSFMLFGMLTIGITIGRNSVSGWGQCPTMHPVSGRCPEMMTQGGVVVEPAGTEGQYAINWIRICYAGHVHKSTPGTK